MVRRVVLTRPVLQNAKLVQSLAGHDVEVISAPVLTIEPLRDDAEMAAVPPPDGFDLVVFVSGNAVRYYLQLCMTRPNWAGWPSGVAGAAVGEATFQALREHAGFGAQPLLYAPSSGTMAQDSEALLACLRAVHAPRWRVLIVRGQEGRPWLIDQLRAEGSAVQACTVYRRQPASWAADIWGTLGQWREADAHPAWIYTSSQGLAVVAAHMAAQGWTHWWARCPALVTHPRLVQIWAGHAGVASDAGSAVVKVCLPTVDALFEAIVSLCMVDPDRVRIQSHHDR